MSVFFYYACLLAWAMYEMIASKCVLNPKDDLLKRDSDWNSNESTQEVQRIKERGKQKCQRKEAIGKVPGEIYSQCSPLQMHS